MSSGSLRNKTIKGVAWSGVDNVVQYAVTFIVSIILARLLSPDDYGLIGIIGIFTAISNTLVSYGLTIALIRKKDASEDDYNTIFGVNLVMSILLYTVIYFCAPEIASFFGRQELILLTRISCTSIIIGALSIVQYARLTKRIDFKTQTKITFIASISSGIVGIIMALLGCGVWSLVVQGLVSVTVRTILLWLFNKWVPNFRFSKNSFNELFGFGWKLMLSALLDSIWKELYQVIVGKYYNPATLGQYTRANHFSQLFSNNLTNIIQRVSFPVLSNMQENRVRMVAAYRKIIKMTMFITALCMFFLSAISEPLLYCLIGPKWTQAAQFLPLICLSGSLYPLHAINLNMLQVLGRSDLFLKIEVVKKVIAIGPLCVGVFIGIIPMLYANIVAGLIGYYLNSYYSGKFLGYSTWMQIKDITPSLCVAVAVSFSVYYLKYLPVSYWIVLPLQIFVGLIVFFAVNMIVKNKEYEELKQIIHDIIYKKMLNSNKKV